MSTAAMEVDLNLKARDVTGQRAFSVKRFAQGATVGELISTLMSRMGLASEDSKGRPHVYRLFLKREGRHVHSSEIVGEALRPDDELIVQPDVQAGLR